MRPVRSATAGPALDRRRAVAEDRTLAIRIQATLLALAAVGWSTAAWGMHGMAMGPWSELGTFWPFVAIWIAMMAAMMLPSTTPAATLYRQLRAARGPVGGGLPGFVAGYLLAWAAVGVAVFGLDFLVRSLPGEPLAWSGGGRWVAAGALSLAAVWQATPLKDVCLQRCRNPAGLLTRSWRDGISGAVVLGARIGGWCMACCWALMLALLALGMMNLLWMAVVTLVIAVERLAPWPRASARTAAVLLIVMAAAVAAAPGRVPGLGVGGGMTSDAMPASRAAPPARKNMTGVPAAPAHDMRMGGG
jgi:predicted metal-binding membrane protein